jgi:hypothetical protein
MHEHFHLLYGQVLQLSLELEGLGLASKPLRLISVTDAFAAASAVIAHRGTAPMVFCRGPCHLIG